MNFAALADDWSYLLLGTFPDGPRAVPCSR